LSRVAAGCQNVESQFQQRNDQNEQNQSKEDVLDENEKERNTRTHIAELLLGIVTVGAHRGLLAHVLAAALAHLHWIALDVEVAENAVGQSVVQAF
jgi:hypothetical protein